MSPFVPTTEPDLDYYEARRLARSFLGQHAEVLKNDGVAFPARVGIWVGTKFYLIGAGPTLRAALEDAKTRQKLAGE